MSEAWQVEAVREQFKVLHSLETIQKDLNTNDIRVVDTEVDTIVKNHLRVKEKTNCKPTRHISVEIIKASSGTVKFGFIVIVTDQRVNGLLSKIPIFVIQCGQTNVFIDTSCFSFRSWDSFLQTHFRNVLPPGNFCFPVNGQYLNGKRLKINFAKNQTLSTGKRLGWKLLVSGLTIGAFTASFFVNVKPTLDFLEKKLIPVAKKHLESFNGPLVKEHITILNHILDWKEGKKSWHDKSSLIFDSLDRILEHYEEDIISITSEIEYKLGNTLHYLKKKFPSVFKRLPTPLRILGHICNNDKSLVGSGDMNISMQMDVSTPPIFENCGNESVFHQSEKEKSEDMNLLRQIDVSTPQIFENCVNESVFHQSRKEKSQDEPLDLTPCNKALVCMTSDFVHTHHQNPSQNELSNLYLILKKLVVDESTERLKLYHKCRVAAHNSGSGININEYNRRLGITGDPNILHFFIEAVNHLNQSPVIQYLVTSKCRELVKQEPVQLIQCSKMPNNEKFGIYKFIGMENGLIPPNNFIKPLKEIFCNDEDNELFDEDKLVVKEEGDSQLSSRIVFLSNKLNVFIRQYLTNEEISHGFLAVIAND